MATFDEFIGSLEGVSTETNKGKKFEVFCKWFLENDPEWSKTVETVWLWDDYPHKWQRQDLGTDLVFKDNEGQIWAVQAKCFSEHRTTTKGDMNSFLADTGRKEVHRRLWLQTTNKMEAKAEKTLKGQDKPTTVFTLNDFRNAQIDYPNSFSELFKAKVKQKPRPDPHQLEAITNVKLGLETQDRGQMIMACGTGKTFTTLWIKEALEAHTTLVLLPSLSLLSQTMREWAWAGNTDFDILNVCSDQSVGKKTEDMDPADAPFPVTSDVHEIAVFLQRESSKVIFCTYQSSDLIAQAQLDKSVPTIDLAIADEAHRCAGKADAGFATILDRAKIRAKKRLFTTATPRYFGNAIKDAAKDRDLEVIGMDNETVFGPVIHKLTFGQAIENDLLTDYQVVIVGVDEPMVKEWIDNYEIVTTGPDKETDARTLAAKIGLIKAIKDYDLKRVISFHSRVKGAKDFAEEFTDVVDHIEPKNRPDGLFLTDYVSGEMKAGDRKEKIDKLKALDGYERGIITNARCLAEGVDVPSLDGVAFIDPKGSQVEIIQAVGRAIRKVRGAAVQKKGTIVLPVFIEAGDDPESAIEASNFKPVWDVLKALRAHDEVLADTLDQYRTNMAKNAFQNRERISDKVIFDMPTSVGVEFSVVLRTVIVEAATAPWEFWYGLLKVFKDREGHCRVVKGYQEGGYNLANWVVNLRAKKYSLDPKRIQRLEDLGFIWDPINEAWEEGFRKLLSFKDQQGHCRVPRGYNKGGFNLGQWVTSQRSNGDKLSPDRRQLLDDLGFIWDPHSFLWEEGFSNLLSFMKREGHSRVHVGYLEKGFQLGRWVSRQRTESLTPDRRQRLDDIGFVWDALTEMWDDAFMLLQTFKLREGHCRVFIGHTEAGFDLGQWVRVQRTTESKISLERKQRLDEIGFDWDPFGEQWEKGFCQLQRFYKREGHCRVPIGFKEGEFKLGGWVATQRNGGGMTLDRRQRLDEIGFVWDPRFEAWAEGLSNLKVFVDSEGHANVPQSYVTASKYKLGSWLSAVRAKRQNLPKEKIAELESLSGWSWSPREGSWDRGIAALERFFNEHGHAAPTKTHINGDGFKIGAWVGEARSNKDNLSKERVDQLEVFEGWTWDALEAKWEADLTELKAYIAQFGNSKVPRDYVSLTGFKLGEWCKGCRTRYKKADFNNPKRKELDRLGFDWDPHGGSWEKGFYALKAFQIRERHCNVPSSHVENGLKLGHWVRNQRSIENQMTAERRIMLEGLGFVWGTKKDKS